MSAGNRIPRDQLAYLRAVAEGMSPIEAARRYLGVESAHAAPGRHREVVERIAAVARRLGDSRWRLLSIVIEPPAAHAAEQPPSLEEWADAEGLEGWSQAELQSLYLDRFGAASDARTRRRQARNARLLAHRLALLRALEAMTEQPAKPQDPVAAWFAPALAERLQSAGFHTLGDLHRRLALGGRWWAHVSAFGPRKAAQLARRVEQLLGPAPAWPGARSAATASPTAARDAQPVPRTPDRGTAVDTVLRPDDESAVLDAWVASLARAPLTVKAYEREAQRFHAWCRLERGRALSDVSADDCTAYLAFLADVPDRWISRRQVARGAPGWAPFRGSLSVAGQRLAAAALSSLFAWLVTRHGLKANPWLLVDRPDASAARAGGDPRARSFTEPAWRAMQAQLDREGDTPSAVRLRWLLTFVQATGLRSAELMAATAGALQQHGRGWCLLVPGPGGCDRLVAVPSSAYGATRAYFEARGLDLGRTAPDVPLVATLADPSRPLSYSALHGTFTRFVRRAIAASPLTQADRQAAARATMHWLRHTHASRAADRQVPLGVLQAQLGHKDPRSAAGYYRALLDERQAEMERIHGEGEGA